MTPTTLEALKAARERISDPKRWTQGEYAKNTQGEVCNANSSEACKWCAAGAVLAEVGVDLPNVRAAEPLTLLANAIEGLPLGDEVAEDIAIFNDNPVTTHADVLAMFDRAIELAEEEEARERIARG